MEIGVAGSQSAGRMKCHMLTSYAIGVRLDTVTCSDASCVISLSTCKCIWVIQQFDRTIEPMADGGLVRCRMWDNCGVTHAGCPGPDSSEGFEGYEEDYLSLPIDGPTATLIEQLSGFPRVADGSSLEQGAVLVAHAQAQAKPH